MTPEWIKPEQARAMTEKPSREALSMWVLRWNRANPDMRIERRFGLYDRASLARAWKAVRERMDEASTVKA